MTSTRISSHATTDGAAGMLPPAATDISGFGGGRGRERAGFSLQRWQAEMQSTLTTERPAAASLPPSTSEPAYVGGRGQEHGGYSISGFLARIRD